MIVMKFGGTSVKDSQAMRKVISIVKDKKSAKPLVVLSACAGITDKVEKIFTKMILKNHNKARKIIREIHNYHIGMVNQLIKEQKLRKVALGSVNYYIDDLKRLFNGVLLLKEITPRNTAKALSYGELLSSTIFYFACKNAGLNTVFQDAREIMKTDSNYLEAEIDFSRVKKNIKKIDRLFNKYDIVITQGFIASDMKGITTILGRGGSDYSAAVLGSSSSKAKEIQIWTDVSGIYTTDPELIKKARRIHSISFAEVKELSYYGAKVLHPDTIKPAVEKNIPVRILNTYKPKEKGTIIIEEAKTRNAVLRSVILKRNCKLITINIPPAENSMLFYSGIIDTIVNEGTKILYSVYTQNYCRLLLENKNGSDVILKSILRKYENKFEENSLICICGSKLNKVNKSEKLTKFFMYISKMNIKQIIFGASNESILLLTDKENDLKILKKIHSLIISSK
jgi:aspartate kinase